MQLRSAHRLRSMSTSQNNVEDISIPDNRNIQDKVDAYWQDEFDIPYLTNMLERRQRLLSSMRRKSRATAKPLDRIYYETNNQNIELQIKREQLKMMIEDVVARQIYVAQNAVQIQEKLQQRCNYAVAKYYAMVCALFLASPNCKLLTQIKMQRSRRNLKI